MRFIRDIVKDNYFDQVIEARDHVYNILDSLLDNGNISGYREPTIEDIQELIQRCIDEGNPD